MNYKKLVPKLDLTRLPAHVGIIMDGNGRWAASKKRPRMYGHRAGARSVRQVVELGVELKLGYITFYAFSTENWSRPDDEVQGLLKLLKEFLAKEIAELKRQNIRVNIIGSESRLDPVYLAEIREMASPTFGNTGLTVNMAFNYGGRLEIVEGIQKLFAENLENPEAIKNLTPQAFSNYLYTAGQPDPDLIIRTSGERRISNFLLWQMAYSEIYITQTLWPDFDKASFIEALLDFQSRERRYGGVESQ
ncbi:MAG: isoprenyl transferase [Candidatus Cloacimonadaceae bacterium]|jgi:undecaprenyl diphosphate synthase|nr:isoprenyl transferase [Candidatus Cloacimonadota bacterium]MDX9949888.1 isoprenyl transferase [Candidatus Syntrophosphaera sp.]